MLDAVVAAIMGLSMADLRHVLAECDTEAANIDGQHRKGFWRIDKDRDPELRPTVLALVAFQALEARIAAAGGDRQQGVEAFLTQNHGEGWMLPEELRLTDYGLGHDERAKHLQPVVSRLGLRFYDFQLIQSAKESWRECQLHARNLLGRSYPALSNESVDSPQFNRDRDFSNEPLQTVAERDLAYRTGRTLGDDQGDLFERVDD